MRSIWPLLALSIACSPRPVAPPLVLEGALSTEGGVDIWWTDPGTAPGEEQDPELDDALVNLIDAATTTVDLALYEFDLDSVSDAILDAWDRGVDVRMVGDGDEVHDAGYLALEAAGIPIESRPAGNRIMHHKFVVVDDQAVWTGSTNVSHNGMFRNDNHALIVRSSTMAAAYTYEFEEMFGGEFGRGKTALAGTRSIDLSDGTLDWHFSPTHDPIQVVVDAIDDAEHTVAFMVFSFTRSDVVDALQRAQQRGVDVVGIFDESQANGSWSVDETLALAGVPVFIDGNENASGFSGGKLHHKVLVVDAGTPDATVISGSMNWSNAGTDDNDENLVLLRSPSIATPMMAEFCGLLQVATPHPDFTGETPDVCDTTTTPIEVVDEVVINEAMRTAYRQGGGNSFIELVSNMPDSIDLDGWQVQDGLGRTIHTFGPHKLKGDGVVLLVGPDWSGPTRHTVSTQRPLRLGNRGALTLVRPDATLADTFSLDGAAPGESLNRVLDGDATTEPLPHSALTAASTAASPGRRLDGSRWTDAPPADVLTINELLPNPDGDDLGAEFVELVNAGPVPMDPTGYTLCDASGVCHTFGPPVLLPGEAMVLFDQGDHTDVPGVRLSNEGRLSLNNSGDTLTLTDPDGAVHEAVSWSGSSTGMSWNRTVDGAPHADWSHHDDVQGATSDSSPGFRVDGTAWR